MKTFKEWLKELKIACPEEWASENEIKTIQQEAFKAGMTSAAELCVKESEGLSGRFSLVVLGMAGKIEDERDSLK